MFIRDAMVSRPLVVRPQTSLTEFVDAVLASSQTTATVIDADSKVVGIISLQDVCHAIGPAYLDAHAELGGFVHEGYFDEKFEELERRTVSEIMTRDVTTVEPGEAVIRAVIMFAQLNRKSLPVIEDGRFAGTVTRRSVFRCVRRPKSDSGRPEEESP